MKLKQSKLFLFFKAHRNKRAIKAHYNFAKNMPKCDYECYLKKRTFNFFQRYSYSKKYAYEISFSNPKTYVEKMQWLKLYDQSEKKTILTDKYSVRKYIKNTIGSDYLVPLINIDGKEVFETPKQIDFSKLPNKFVLKCTHGSHMNIVVNDKSSLSKKDIQQIKRRLKKWMTINYAFYVGLELQYKDIKPRIIIEQFLDDGQPSLCDYKFFCYKGVPRFFSINQNRSTSSYTETYFDLNFKKLPFTLGPYKNNDFITEPEELSKLIDLSKILSKDFIHVRVDFYIVDHRIYFGELTFSPGCGFEFPNPMKYDYELGELIAVDCNIREKNYAYRNE